jgi:hypothetical protein
MIFIFFQFDLWNYYIWMDCCYGRGDGWANTRGGVEAMQDYNVNNDIAVNL